MPMCEPTRRVPSPVTLPAEMRGRTTQNRVSSISRLSASRVSCAVTMTRVRSSLSVTVRTSPMSTFLYLILVLRASMPSPDLNEIVIVSPRSRNA